MTAETKPVETKKPDYESLIVAACEAASNAYARYSGFRVGAAIRTTSGEVFAGCNVENASYGLAICAERVAVSAAITAGHQEFEAIAIVSQGGVTPCGACRQFLCEFGDMNVILVDASKPQEVQVRRLSDLLPESFSM